jgi:hypothetical protein
MLFVASGRARAHVACAGFTEGQERARHHADLEVAIAELDALMSQPLAQHVRLSQDAD